VVPVKKNEHKNILMQERGNDGEDA
jgi:hypothetical protein